MSDAAKPPGTTRTTGGEDGAAGTPERPRRPLAPLTDMLRPRLTRGQLAGALLSLVLGFAVVAQVQANNHDTKFATARQDELVGILSDLTQRSERLRGDLRDLENTKAGLERDARGQTALEEARRRADDYGLLAGTVPAQGPGVEITVTDPRRAVRAANLLDALEELRDAGAEVVQVGDVRTGVDTYFVDGPEGVLADGRFLPPPYRILAIGDPHTMATALGIPGGVVRTLRGLGAEVTVTPRARMTVSAVRSG
ncbi:DUF881 domain-containing protein [Actinomadura logoneensis]|uniref:DUF881 domain-containing protein n=1 Tax=Actinomadura logoneensis TaxID=2293572 RepID=A0A372JT89_9ACTN|nr:DUF881 domain-containing protein [Actinomadura logoneensis]RFU42984.1 DUF881 domain-containing protein [Actinomadura logoneensis]